MELKSPIRLVDSVYEHLRETILSGSFHPGDRLSVPELAKKLSVSRSPIREAVQRLVQDGLAVEEPRRGAIVTLISAEDLVRLYEIREVLEGLSARLAAERSNLDIGKLQVVLEAHEQAIAEDDFEARQIKNIEFHSIIRQAADNPELLRWLDTIEAKVRLAMRRTGLIKGDVEETIKEHRSIFDAIASRDAVAAEYAARKHIRRIRGKLLSLP